MRAVKCDPRALWRALAALGVGFLFAVPALAQDAAQPAPGLTEAVIASVNDDVITNYDLGQRMRLLAITAGIQPTRDDIAQLQQYALSSLIDERLEIQELKREEKEQKFSIIATDTDVDDEISGMAKSNNMTAAQLLNSLAQQGVGAETLRSQLQAQISWRNWIRGRYGSRLRVGEDQIKEFQERLAAEADKPKYLISEVFIDAQKAGGEQAAVDEATQLVGQLHQGAPFASVARQFSAASTAANGGDAGWLTQGELPAEVQQAVADLRPGSLSSPIQVKDGVYIVYLRDKQAGGTSQLVSLKQAAIALPADAPPDQVDAAKAKLELLRGQLHGCDNFEAIAGKVDGVLAGDLGEADAKDLAPAFKEAALSLPVGQVSEPIRSDQGVHLVAVCKRRSNAAQGLDHDQIEDRLMGEQLNMINKREIRDLRNSAAIEIKEARGGG